MLSCFRLSSRRRLLQGTSTVRHFANSDAPTEPAGLSAEQKEAIRAYRRAEKLRQAIATVTANPLVGRDMKTAKHPPPRFTTAILTNGATVLAPLPYYRFKYLRLEDDYVSLAKSQETRPLPVRERRVQPAQYLRKRYKK
jgi:glucose-6-phosphate-specific signal transduction histidine kinase